MSNIQKEIVNLQKKRDDLRIKLDQAREGVASQKQKLTDDALSGRDTGVGVDLLTRQERTVVVLEAAISQADDELRRLEQQQINDVRDAARARFDQIETESYKLLSDSVDQIVATLDRLAAEIEPRFAEMRELAPQAGGDFERVTESARFTLGLYRYMTISNGAVDNFPHVIKTLRERRDVLAQVWKNNR